jgi:hypothetical protein
MVNPATPATIKITPMPCGSTCAGFQVTANRRIAPMTMSAMLPPIVTGLPQMPGLLAARCNGVRWAGSR